jgi:hypothetical protein
MIYRVVVPTALLVFAGLVLAVTRPTGAGPGEPPASQAARGPETAGLCLSASVARPSFGCGDPIDVTTTLENVGKEAVRVPLSSLLATFEFDVTLPTGKSAPLTLCGKHEEEVALQRGASMSPLQPGARSTIVIHLNRVFDMTLEGEYKITVRRRITSHLTVSSNTIVLTIAGEPGATTSPADELQVLRMP